MNAVSALAALGGVALLAIVLWDAFEVVLLPRRIPRALRLSRLLLKALWILWAVRGRAISDRNRREDFLGLYALLSLIVLVVLWAVGLIVGFAALNWAFGSHLASAGGHAGFRTDLYMSGTTFFTLGLGDVSPTSPLARLVTVIEAGTGFGFLALMLAYVPVLYQSFSKRETRTTMLDQWAGSPPTSAVLLRRCFESRDPGAALNQLLRDWELAAAEILESHLSYPILAYFRSQHDNQSWLASVGAILDACTLVIAGVEGVDPFQARLTFAICRHALVDVSQNLGRSAVLKEAEREDPAALQALRDWLAQAGVRLDRSADAEARLHALRALYRPYARALSDQLLMPLPGWLPLGNARFNWETTAWAKTRPGRTHSG